MRRVGDQDAGLQCSRDSVDMCVWSRKTRQPSERVEQVMDEGLESDSSSQEDGPK